MQQEFGIEVSAKFTRLVLKKDLSLSYLKAKKLNTSANSDKNLVLRQQYGLEMMQLLKIGQRVINIDETWLNETSFVRRTWAERKGAGNAVLNSVGPRISMIAAIDTDGHVWYSLSHANTDSNVMTLFLTSLT